MKVCVPVCVLFFRALHKENCVSSATISFGIAEKMESLWHFFTNVQEALWNVGMVLKWWFSEQKLGNYFVFWEPVSVENPRSPSKRITSIPASYVGYGGGARFRLGRVFVPETSAMKNFKSIKKTLHGKFPMFIQPWFLEINVKKSISKIDISPKFPWTKNLLKNLSRGEKNLKIPMINTPKICQNNP